jgi:hypothetical protein
MPASPVQQNHHHLDWHHLIVNVSHVNQAVRMLLAMTSLVNV